MFLFIFHTSETHTGDGRLLMIGRTFFMPIYFFVWLRYIWCILQERQDSLALRNLLLKVNYFRQMKEKDQRICALTWPPHQIFQRSTIRADQSQNLSLMKRNLLSRSKIQSCIISSKNCTTQDRGKYLCFCFGTKRAGLCLGVVPFAKSSTTLLLVEWY